jgi:GNAT superfamily N-acetyltransferase
MSNLSFETIVSTDIAQLVKLQPEGWRDIIPKFEDYLNQKFCFPIKLIENQEIIAIGSVIVHQDVAWLGHIIVHPNHRKKGYGKLMTQQLIETAKAENCTSIQLIATDLGAPVYKSIGFITDTEYLFFKDVNIPAHQVANPHISSYNAIYKDQMLALDSLVSGENRACELENHLAPSYLYVIDGSLAGYYLPTFGEGLIIAIHPTVGKELTEFHLQTKTTVVIPKENIAAQAFLQEHQYQPYASAKRMYIGREIAVKFECIFNRIAGNIG